MVPSNQNAISFAVVTGASSGIGLELARVAAEGGSDLLVVADGPDIEAVATELARTSGVHVESLMADLATRDGVDALHGRLRDLARPIDALFANAGRGLGHGFLDQDFNEIERVINTNIIGTVYLLHKVMGDMRSQGWGRVLITGSIAGLMPGTYQAVYNATKAFIDSFAYALREEVKDDGITVTVLMPGPTDTDFFETADLLDTKVGAGKKDDPRMVAKAGYDAMLRGDGHEVSGFANKLQAMMTRVLGDKQLAKMHEGMAKPGSAPSQH
ncbi:SDR family NAD(P)-dependent oxidoreductase [Devosia sp. A16]|uniref:SDR family NAD(P)-dependent oxidoreductase n=1 Tax=Devosia sp. A16 TaxID=1736675 RepID=UPI0006D7F9D9|nr:SDR family NAD(P)-dependent oxidoreductase [Devosia sp. A16]